MKFVEPEEKKETFPSEVFVNTIVTNLAYYLILALILWKRVYRNFWRLHKIIIIRYESNMSAEKGIYLSCYTKSITTASYIITKPITKVNVDM